MSFKTVLSISLLTLGVTFNARAWEGDDVEIKRERETIDCPSSIDHIGRGGSNHSYYFINNSNNSDHIDIYIKTGFLKFKKIADSEILSIGNIIELMSGCKYRVAKQKFRRQMGRAHAEYFYAEQLQLIRQN